MSGGIGCGVPSSCGGYGYARDSGGYSRSDHILFAGIALVLALFVGAFGSVFWNIHVREVRDRPRIAAWRAVYDRAEISGYCGSATIYRDLATGRLVRFGVFQGDYDYFPEGATLQSICPSPVPRATDGGGLDMNSAMLGAMGASLLK